MTDPIEPEERSRPLEHLLDYLTAQRFFLSVAETRAAEALLAEGFDFVEVAAFFQNSAWGTFYRKCLEDHHLPETPCILAALREAFDLRLSSKEASERAMDALRRYVEALDGPDATPELAPIQHDAASLAFEIELFGVDGVRRKNWPTWMLDLVKASDKNSESDGSVA